MMGKGANIRQGGWARNGRGMEDIQARWTGGPVSRGFRKFLTKLKCTQTLIGTTPRHGTVQSPEVEQIRRAEVKGSSRQQPAASTGPGCIVAIAFAASSRWNCGMLGAPSPLRWDRGDDVMMQLTFEDGRALGQVSGSMVGQPLAGGDPGEPLSASLRGPLEERGDPARSGIRIVCWGCWDRPRWTWPRRLPGLADCMNGSWKV